jgi:urease accessory protein UreH
MPIRLSQRATRQLTRTVLVLSPRGASAGWWARVALAVVALLAVAAAAQIHLNQCESSAQENTSALQQVQALQHELEQSRLTQRVAAARSQELEREIDVLHRTLRESQDELTFFRKARDGKR